MSFKIRNTDPKIPDPADTAQKQEEKKSNSSSKYPPNTPQKNKKPAAAGFKMKKSYDGMCDFF